VSTIQLTRAQRRQMQKPADRVDRVTQADRMFFERFPDRMHRVRLASQAEIEQQELIHGAALWTPPHCRIFVVVRNVAPGARMRLFIFSVEGSETDLDETTAAKIFAASATEQTWKIEAELRKAAEARP
jgi:hypothetical protein